MIQFITGMRINRFKAPANLTSSSAYLWCRLYS